MPLEKNKNVGMHGVYDLEENLVNIFLLTLPITYKPCWELLMHCNIKKRPFFHYVCL